VTIEGEVVTWSWQ